jgi:hypothetical protein
MGSDRRADQDRWCHGSLAVGGKIIDSLDSKKVLQGTANMQKRQVGEVKGKGKGRME